MPPIGSTLDDEQIASVLTYIRREWGQTGDPVDAATVKATRAETASQRGHGHTKIGRAHV